MNGVTLAIGSVASLTLASPLLIQEGARPDSFFWAGLLTALVPMLVLGALGGVAVHLYLRERRSSERGQRDGEARDGGST